MSHAKDEFENGAENTLSMKYTTPERKIGDWSQWNQCLTAKKEIFKSNQPVHDRFKTPANRLTIPK
jgi:hypothetical protein